MDLSDTVLHVKSNGGIFMFISSLQRPKLHFKLSACNFRRLYDLGIKNRRIDFIFAMCIEETSLHNKLFF